MEMASFNKIFFFFLSFPGFVSVARATVWQEQMSADNPAMMGSLGECDR